MSFARILLFLVTSLLWAVPAMAQRQLPVAHIAASEWPPYINSDPDNPGAIVEIVTQAFTLAGYTPEISILPWHRAVSKIEDGTMSVLLAVYDSKRNQDRYMLSSYLMYIDSIFAALADSEATRSGPRKYHKVSVVKDSMLDRDLRRKKFEHIEIAPDVPSNMKKLLTNRVDLILDTEATVLEAINELPVQQRSKIRVLHPPFASRSIHAAILPGFPHHQDLFQALEKGLKKLHNTGKYAEIMLRHGFLTDKAHNTATLPQTSSQQPQVKGGLPQNSQ